MSSVSEGHSTHGAVPGREDRERRSDGLTRLHRWLMGTWLARRWAPWLVWLLGIVSVVVLLARAASDLPRMTRGDVAVTGAVLGIVYLGWFLVVTVYAALSEFGGPEVVPYRTLLIMAAMLWPILHQVLLFV